MSRISRGHALSLLALVGQVAALAAQFAVARRLGTEAVVDGWIAAQNVPALASALAIAVAGQLAMPALARRQQCAEAGTLDASIAALARRFAFLGSGIAGLALIPSVVVDLCAPGLAPEARAAAIRLFPALALTAAPAGLTAVLVQSAALRDRHFACAAVSPGATALSLLAFWFAPTDAALHAMIWAQTAMSYLAIPLCARMAGVSLRAILRTKDSGVPAMTLAGVLPVLLIAGSARINLAVDAYFASSMDAGQLALFGYATRGVALLQAVLIAPVTGLVFSSLSRAAARGDWPRFADESRRATLSGWNLSVPAAAVVAALGFELATLLLGPAESEAARRSVATCLLALSGIVVFGVWGSILARVCVSAGKLRLAVWFLGIVPTGLNLALDAWLAPLFGIAGLAAVTSLNAAIGLPILHFWLARQGLTRGPLLVPLVVRAASAGASALLAVGAVRALPTPQASEPASYGLWVAALALTMVGLYFALLRGLRPIPSPKPSP